MKTFARVLMAVLMAINSVAGGSSALVACVGIDGLHIEFSSQHSCAGHCEKSSPDEVTLEADPHRHCEDFVFTSPLFKDFSDTRQLFRLRKYLAPTPPSISGRRICLSWRNAGCCRIFRLRLRQSRLKTICRWSFENFRRNKIIRYESVGSTLR